MHDDVSRDGARVDRYLASLGVQAEPPSVAALRRLHRAHVLRFPHDTLWKLRGRIPELEPVALVEALLAGEGGTCLHLNGGFTWLLQALGYDATLHRARIQRGLDDRVRPRLGLHAVVTVDVEGSAWYADVGLGNGPLDPMPLREGTYPQEGGFTYALQRLDDPEMPWHFSHDRHLRGLRAVEMCARAAVVGDFADVWADGTNPAAAAVTPLVVNRREERAVLTLWGDTLVRRSEGEREARTFEDAGSWERALREELGLALPGWDAEERDRLWLRCRRSRPESEREPGLLVGD